MDNTQMFESVFSSTIENYGKKVGCITEVSPHMPLFGDIQEETLQKKDARSIFC